MTPLFIYADRCAVLHTSGTRHGRHAQFRTVELQDFHRLTYRCPEILHAPHLVDVKLEAEETPPLLADSGHIGHIPEPSVELVHGQVLHVAQFTDTEEDEDPQSPEDQGGTGIMDIDENQGKCP